MPQGTPRSSGRRSRPSVQGILLHYTPSKEFHIVSSPSPASGPLSAVSPENPPSPEDHYSRRVNQEDFTYSFDNKGEQKEFGGSHSGSVNSKSTSHSGSNNSTTIFTSRRSSSRVIGSSSGGRIGLGIGVGTGSGVSLPYAQFNHNNGATTPNQKIINKNKILREEEEIFEEEEEEEEEGEAPLFSSHFSNRNRNKISQNINNNNNNNNKNTSTSSRRKFFTHSFFSSSSRSTSRSTTSSSLFSQQQKRDYDFITTPPTKQSSITASNNTNTLFNDHDTHISPTPSRTVGYDGSYGSNNSHINSNNNRRNYHSASSSSGYRFRSRLADLPSPIETPGLEQEPPLFVVSPVKASYSQRDSLLSAVSKDDTEPPPPNPFLPSSRPPPLTKESTPPDSPPDCDADETATIFSFDDFSRHYRASSVSSLEASAAENIIGVAIGGHQRGRHQKFNNTPSTDPPKSKKSLPVGLNKSIHCPTNPNSLATPPQLNRIVSAPSQLNPPKLTPTASFDDGDSSRPTPPPSRAGHKRANSASFSNRSIKREPPAAPESSEPASVSQTKSLPARIKDKKILPLPKRSRLPARFSSNGVATPEAPPPSLIYRQHLPKKSSSSSSSSSQGTPQSNNTSSTTTTPTPRAQQVSSSSGSSDSTKKEDKQKSDKKKKNYDSDKKKEETTPTPRIILSVDKGSKKIKTPNRSPYNTVRFSSNRTSPSMSGATKDLRIPSDQKYGVHLLEDEDDDPTIRANNERVSPLLPSQKNDTINLKKDRTDSSTPNNDDVFLNLARSNTVTSNSTNDSSARRRQRLVSHGQYRNQLNTEYTRSSYNTTTPPSNRVIQDPYTPSDTSPLSSSVHYQSTHFDDPDTEHSLAHRSSFIRRSLRDRDNQPVQQQQPQQQQQQPQHQHHQQQYQQQQQHLQNGGHSRSFSEAPRTPLTRYTGLSSQRTIGSLVEHDRAAAAAAAAANNYASSRANDETESVSTTAPSMIMWDELDELKSRIRKLEMTGGRMPGSPNAPQGSLSNSSSERPRTGTTAATTVSTSPHHHTNSNGQPADQTSPTMANAVPSSQAPTVLQTALHKSKSVLPPEIFNALEAASSDALSLAQMAGGPGNPSPSAMITERQVRRKIESMCRSLTELCISLSDGRMPLTQEEEEMPPLRIGYTPTTNDTHMERPGEYRSPSAIGSRIDRNVAATPSSGSKIFSRFESRRGSILSNASNSPAHHRIDASPSPAPPPQHRISQRNSMILRNRSSTINMDDEDPDQTIMASNNRSMSRSQTESILSGESPRQSDFASVVSGQSGGLPTQVPTPRASTYGDRIQRAPSVAASDVSRSSNLSHRRHFSSAVSSSNNHSAASSTQNLAGAGSRRFFERSSIHTDGPLIGTAITTNTSPVMSATARAIAMDQMRRREVGGGGAGAADVQMPGDEVYGTSPSLSTNESSRLRNGGSIGRVGSVSRRAMLGNHTYRDNHGAGLGREREILAQRNAAR